MENSSKIIILNAKDVHEHLRALSVLELFLNISEEKQNLVIAYLKSLS